MQSSILLERSGEIEAPSVFDIPFNAIFLAASSIAIWQTWLQHSLTGSILPQAAKSPEESTILSNSSISVTGQEACVRFSGWNEHIFWRLSFAPWLTRIFSTSERQCLEWVLFKARIPEYLLDCPIIITSAASNWGQHTTLAKYGAKEAQQSVAVMLITLSAAEKFNVQSPER